jgi:hypothetical protein
MDVLFQNCSLETFHLKIDGPNEATSLHITPTHVDRR